ncbi:chorismate mutase [Virgibacillus oceani]|uniref:chorismate mutase n=1 Tax=Virgibacillus oceani TaxID=1479511 RepID=A0A917H2H0_9BACI|nr:chorismate mutase [Virgibacillus oceani]GGG65304.1 chorismate mutase AroH [Virgibacillus oceani]
MIRGLRGATTVTKNEEKEIHTNTRLLVEEMVRKNNVEVESISHVFISVTKDLNAGFPAKSLRQIDGWTYVPVMCMTEIDVPNSLAMCIRVMMIVNTEIEQQEIKHVFQNGAVSLRPDLVK